MKQLQIDGWTSDRNAHKHVLKHVLRCTEARDTRDQTDPENWSALLDNIPKEVRLRWSNTSKLIERIDGCEAGRRLPTRASPCHDCDDRKAQGEASDALAPYITGYTGVASEVLAFAGETHSKAGSRLVAYHSHQGPMVLTWDNRSLKLVGSLDEQSGKVKLVAFFRDTTKRSMTSRLLELARLRASHRQLGTAIEIN